MPDRVQLSRRKGWRLPENTVNVARPSRYGNAHRVGADETYYGGPGHERATAEQCVELYRQGIEAIVSIEPYYLEPLRGKNLACWCGAGPCHADVLLDLANRPVCEAPPHG